MVGVKHTDKEIRGMVAHWQERLSLRDWRITLHICDHMPDNDQGVASPHSQMKDADVWIARRGVDPEWCVVHELIHIVLWHRVDDNSELDEQSINALTGALLQRKNNLT